MRRAGAWPVLLLLATPLAGQAPATLTSEGSARTAAPVAASPVRPGPMANRPVAGRAKGDQVKLRVVNHTDWYVDYQVGTDTFGQVAPHGEDVLWMFVGYYSFDAVARFDDGSVIEWPQQHARLDEETAWHLRQ